MICPLFFEGEYNKGETVGTPVHIVVKDLACQKKKSKYFNDWARSMLIFSYK
ncbi:hypothetical protein DPMN_023938 [Dreissena polymorpha]|uniref:Uncharacterized protein n=1 Tax=Dreissena polymorpha TaxID=45954 RepID=A0A9D4LNV0_DREPO|nr:hypothetical protein DPMN_023938 [Dreissena polymorpha]